MRVPSVFSGSIGTSRTSKRSPSYSNGDTAQYELPAKSLASVKNGENAIVSGLRIVAVSRSVSPGRGCASNGAVALAEPQRHAEHLEALAEASPQRR